MSGCVGGMGTMTLSWLAYLASVDHDLKQLFTKVNLRDWVTQYTNEPYEAHGDVTDVSQAAKSQSPTILLKTYAIKFLNWLFELMKQLIEGKVKGAHVDVWRRKLENRSYLITMISPNCQVDLTSQVQMLKEVIIRLRENFRLHINSWFTICCREKRCSCSALSLTRIKHKR